MSQAPSPQLHMPPRVYEHQDSAQLMRLQSAKDQWLNIAKAGGLERVSAAALQTELASLLETLATVAAVNEQELSLMSSLVCSVLRTLFDVSGQLVADPHPDQLSSAMSQLTFEVAQAAIEVPVTAAPIVAASVEQLLAGHGADAVSSCATALTDLAASCLGLTTATFSSLAWFEKAGTKAFAELNRRLQTVMKDVLMPAVAACVQAATADSTEDTAALCEGTCAQLAQMGDTASLIINGRHLLAGRKEFRSFNTLNTAWIGLVRVLLAVPQELRPAILQLKGFSVAESIGVAMAALDTATRQLVQNITPALLQVVRFWVQHLVKLSPAFPGLVAAHWPALAALLGLLLDRRDAMADHPLAPDVRKYVTPRLADITVAVLGSAANFPSPAAVANDSSRQADADAGGCAMYADSAAQHPAMAAALVDRLCADAAAEPAEAHARHCLRALLHLLGRAQALPAVTRQQLAAAGLPAALAAAGWLDSPNSGGGCGLRREASCSVLCFLAVCFKHRGAGGAAAAAWSDCEAALLAAAVTASSGAVQLLARILCALFRRAGGGLADSFLGTLAALVRAAALASARGALPPTRHLPELLGVLLTAAPWAVQAAWRGRLCQEAAGRIASGRGLPAALAQLTAVRHSMLLGSSPADALQQASEPLAAAEAAVDETLAQPCSATDLPVLLGCLEAAAAIVFGIEPSAEPGADTGRAAQAQRLAQLAAAALQSPVARADPAAALPATRLLAAAAEAAGRVPAEALPALANAVRHLQAQQAATAALRHWRGAGPAAAPHVTQLFHAALQERAWLVRHAAMEALVDVLRGSPELDPRTLVPPALLAPEAAAGPAGCGAPAFAAQLQLYMHRSPPPPPPSPRQPGDGRHSGVSGGDAALPEIQVLADQHTALVAQLAALRAPPAVAAAAADTQETGRSVKKQEILAALADCWKSLEAATASCLSSDGFAPQPARDEVAKAVAALAALQAAVM